ncbi:hypothetical protein AB0O22_25105 [Streptomyces sp. NPDC091204]|uniref:hypothetical protein n=1 Tax=Streptomyces sp. NPDC091204 TaxID=3155299 RepID=UPI00343D84A8
MTDYPCGSCSYGSNDLDELRRHSQETGHVGIRDKDGLLDEARPSARKSGKGRVVAEVALGVLAATAVGVLAWKNQKLAAENDGLKDENDELRDENAGVRSMAGGLLAELAALVAENEFLKSASGAGTTLNGFRGR